MNKTIKALLLATVSFATLTTQAVQIWLQNNYQKSIIVKFNRQETVVAQNNRISLGSFRDLESLFIRTNSIGSFYSNILGIKNEILQNLPSSNSDAVIVIEPSTISWDIKVRYKNNKRKTMTKK
jgi:hypothetical protein